jgi:hypothetical protein
MKKELIITACGWFLFLAAKGQSCPAGYEQIYVPVLGNPIRSL